MRGLRLSTKLLVPDLTTETIGIIGKRGSGKSHTGTLLVEELLELGSQVIVLDPTGGWWGLRAGADGQKDGGYPIPIFGGQHGDMPLEERGGALLAEYVIENRLSAVLDLSDFSKSAIATTASCGMDRSFQRRKTHGLGHAYRTQELDIAFWSKV